jgi:stalled ribosome rescue protein Dom34
MFAVASVGQFSIGGVGQFYSGANSERVPEASEFYERIAQRLKDVPSIILAGDATGKSSAAVYLAEFLKAKHKEVAERVVAMANADLSSITLLEIESIAQGRS